MGNRKKRISADVFIALNRMLFFAHLSRRWSFTDVSSLMIVEEIVQDSPMSSKYPVSNWLSNTLDTKYAGLCFGGMGYSFDVFHTPGPVLWTQSMLIL